MRKVIPMKNAIIVFTLLLASSAVKADEIDPDVQACQQALKSGDFPGAIMHARQSLQTHPKQREAYLCLARAQGGAGKYDAAIATLLDANQLPASPYERVITLTLLGNQYRSAKAYEEALAAYRQSAAIAHDDKNKRYEMIDFNLTGETLQESGHLEEAITAYQQGYKLAANDNERADSHAHLATAYSASGRHDDAVAHQIKATVLEERSGDLDHYAHANLELARIHLVARQPLEAEKVLNKILAVVTEAGDAYWEASVYQLQGRAKYVQGRGEEGKALLARGAVLARKIGAEELAKEIEATDTRM